MPRNTHRLTKPLVLAMALAATMAASARAEEPVFNPAGVRADVTFLADDLLEGRESGTRGFDIAARYVAARFLALGLKPAGNDGTFFQHVTLREARITGTPALAITVDGKPVAIDADKVLFRASLAAKSVAIDAPLVFAGYGLDRSDLGFDDYRGIDVHGKVVVVLAGYPKGVNSELGAHLNAEKSVMAMKRGAIAVITVPSLQDMKRTTWEHRRDGAAAPTRSWVGNDGQAFLRAPTIQTTITLHPDVAAPLFAGARHSLDAILALADKAGGRPHGFAIPATARIDLTSAWTDTQAENVVALLPGTDPAVADETVALTAHLDHLGNHGKGQDRIYNGAMDNAAGVATMLEAARALTASREKPRRSILFAALTGEEAGLLGSDYLARHPLDAARTVVADVNFDMPILLYRFSDVVAFGAEHSTIGPIVAAAARRAGVTLTPDPLPEEGLFTRSDHYRFVQQGIPAVFIVPGFANGGEKVFRDFLATHYHQPSDDLSLPFDWEAGALFAKVNTYIALGLANAADRPRWYAGDFFGQQFAASAPKAPRGGK